MNLIKLFSASDPDSVAWKFVLVYDGYSSH